MIKLKQLIDTLSRITEHKGAKLDDVQAVVEVYNPGSMGGTPCVPVASLELGIDWDANKLILRTAKTLSILSDEEKSAILESVRKGQSWHAYQAHKKLSDEIKTLKTNNQQLLLGCKSIKSMADTFEDEELRSAIKELLDDLIEKTEGNK